MTPDQVEMFRVGAELLGAVVIGVLGYFLKSMIAEFKAKHHDYDKMHAEHKDRLSDLRLHVTENYASKNDLARALEQVTRSVERVFEKLDGIEDKLDRKADKATHHVG